MEAGSKCQENEAVGEGYGTAGKVFCQNERREDQACGVGGVFFK